MSYRHLTEQKKHQIFLSAAKDLRKKMMLEPKFARKMKRFLDKIAADARENYLKNNSILPVYIYKKELSKALLQHYMTVFQSFNNDLRKTSKAYHNYLHQKETKADGDKTKTDAEIEEEIREQSIKYIVDRADTQADVILSTTEKQLTESYMHAELETEEIGTEGANKKIAYAATEEFKKKSAPRPKEISTTETQAVAENTKFIEANTVAYTITPEGGISTAPAESFNPFQYMTEEEQEVLKGQTLKYWVTMADNRVRDGHVEAEGQVTFIDEPFYVMGEELMVPGDTSLGAGPGNICNCRCTARYETIE